MPTSWSLSVKPPGHESRCARPWRRRKAEQLIVSIAAGIPCASLEAWLDQPRPVVRCMPNPGAAAQEARAVRQRAQVQRRATRAGRAVAVCGEGIAHNEDDERKIDAVTTVSGSGPAYFFLC